MSQQQTALVIFPHQLFEAALKTSVDLVILVEDDLFFRQYRFHKQKLILHRASMRAFADALTNTGQKTEYIETSAKHASMSQLQKYLSDADITAITCYDLVDDWLEQRLQTIIKILKLKLEVQPSPGFLTSRGAIDEYFAEHADRMQSFYEWQRRRLNVLIENNKPTGGKWSYDDQNRKSLPKKITLPPQYKPSRNQYVTDAIKWVEHSFPDNPGSTNFRYPITHKQAHAQLEKFLTERFEQFGPYEDAIANNETQLFHSMLSSSLNNGLITPRQVITRSLQFAEDNNVPINSVEGFIRQIIGWREYMRATYIQYGRSMRSGNQLHFKRTLSNSWWDGSTGLDPVDNTISRVLDTAYAHHIERLMVLGNAMLLLRIHPDAVYEWFMELFIDAYDWVMVPNVYAMSQFAAGSKITTKPYISGSNYIRKMSDYASGDWADSWDALYWRFVADHKDLFRKNPRSSMMVSLYDKKSAADKRRITNVSNTRLA
jgi:deoxyribodipyrimidine photolyase-related protein